MNERPKFETGDVVLTTSDRYWLKCGPVWYELCPGAGCDIRLVTSTNWPEDCDNSKVTAIYKGNGFSLDELQSIIRTGNIEPFWERPPVEMTMSELKEKLGYEVKIVGEKE